MNSWLAGLRIVGVGVLIGISAASSVGAQVPRELDSESTDDVTAATALARMTTAPTAPLDPARQLGPMEIDGRLDEEAWADARVFTGFIQQEPV